MNAPRTITPAVTDAGARLTRSNVRLTVVEDLGGGLYVTRLSARLARLQWVRRNTRLEHDTYQLTTLNGVCVAKSRSLGALRVLSAALAESSVWARCVECATGAELCKVFESTPADERATLARLARAAEGSAS